MPTTYSEQLSRYITYEVVWDGTSRRSLSDWNGDGEAAIAQGIAASEGRPVSSMEDPKPKPAPRLTDRRYAPRTPNNRKCEFGHRYRGTECLRCTLPKCVSCGGWMQKGGQVECYRCRAARNSWLRYRGLSA